MRFTLFALLSLLPAGQADQKLDAGIAREGGSQPIFVRMADQLLPGAGALEAFAARHRGRGRLELRREVVASLRSRADASWAKVGECVADLEKRGELSQVTRYWIVNGFAALATGRASVALAGEPAVSFVYLQRGPVQAHLHAPAAPASRPAEIAKEGFKLLQRVAAGWRDDGKDPLPAGLEIPWNLRRIQADQVWEKEGVTGAGVVIALLDTGLLPMPALTAALWRNPGEELDGKDGDGNGLVDDLFGWDFQSGSPLVLGDPSRMPHGSMCAGIMAGRPVAGKLLVTGVAPRARVMVLRGMGHLKAYEYALMMGADILSMSYMWVNMDLGDYRGLYRAAHEHLAAAGIVAVGGAGNFARSAPPGRQIALPKDIPCVLAVAGILEDGNQAPASSQGPCTWAGVRFYDDYPAAKPLAKPDLTALFGGFPCWGDTRSIRPSWKVVWKDEEGTGLILGPAGNSFAGPHAAGVAALVLSANPGLAAWEVKEILEGTALDLGPPGRDHAFGAGLLQALAAVKEAKKRRKG